MRVTRACMCLPQEGAQSTIRRKGVRLMRCHLLLMDFDLDLSGNSFEINFELIYINDLKFCFALLK